MIHNSRTRGKNKKMEKETKPTKVKFRSLSTPVKTAIVFTWVLMVFYVVVFLLGFIEGYFSV